MELIKINNVLISVYDKSGLSELIDLLKKFGAKIYATHGSATYIKETLKEHVTSTDTITGFSDLMEGRVKTLHPKVFGGILARRDISNDLIEAEKYGITLFDLIVVNLYPFSKYIKENMDTQCSFIDIGGPSMIRAGAKAHRFVTVLSHPNDYELLTNELYKNDGKTSYEFRKKMAINAFRRTSEYDALICSTWDREFRDSLRLHPQMPLRYGENSHQKAVWIGEASWHLLQGKELSYNNILDSEAAVRITEEFKDPAVAIVKHNNPCGVSIGGNDLSTIWQRALMADSKSAFGSVVSFNRLLDGNTAKILLETFIEVIIAPGFSKEALKELSTKKNLRLIEWPNPEPNQFELRRAMGGWLLQDSDKKGIPETWKTVTKKDVPPQYLEDLFFAYLVCKHVRSNAIVIAKNKTTVGIGAGQMSRVDAVEIALNKSKHVNDGVLASDAFFPFRDNIDLLNGKVSAIIQPGGSKRDEEVIAACDEYGIPMIFTGERHFRH